MLCRCTRIGTALVALVMSALVIVPAAAADDAVCEGFDKKGRILGLGSNLAFSKTPVKSPGELLAQLEAHRGELEALFAERGLGHLTDEIFAAVESGRGLSERDLVRGEVFEWMAWRKRSGPVTTGPKCFAAKKTYSAYEIQVTEETSQAKEARCNLQAAGNFADQEMSADASGSSDGVEVTVTGPGGTKTVISGGATTWTGMPEGAGDYTFTATAQAQGTRSVTTHTFLLPKICLNVAYAGKQTREEPGEVDTCTQRAMVRVEDPRPTCELQAPAEVMRKAELTVSATGKYDDLVLRVKDDTGRVVQVLSAAGARSELAAGDSFYLKKTGTYTVEGTATKGAYSTTCATTLTVTRPSISPWTLRAFGLTMGTKDDNVFRSTLRPDGVSERSDLSLGGGEGLGLGLEYHVNERVGIEGTVLWASLDATFMFDLDDDWEIDTDSPTFLSFLIGPNFHLTPGKRADFYIGLFVGWADLGDSTFRVLGETHRRDFGSEFVFGAQAGLDIPFGERTWGLHLGARYMDVTAGDDQDELAVDPLIGEVGLFFNF